MISIRILVTQINNKLDNSNNSIIHHVQIVVV